MKRHRSKYITVVYFHARVAAWQTHDVDAPSINHQHGSHMILTSNILIANFYQSIPWKAILPSQVQDQMDPDTRDSFRMLLHTEEKWMRNAIAYGREIHLSWPSTSVKSFESSPLPRTHPNYKNQCHQCPVLHL